MSQLSAEYGIHSSQLYKWKDQVLAGLPNLFNEQAEKNMREKEAEWQQEREALYAEIGRLATEKTWLEKNLEHFLKRDERVALIDWEQKELPISTQARLLHLNRSSLYYQPMPPSSEYNSPHTARTELTRYLHFYNEKRFHQALNYRTPAEIYWEEREIL